MWSMWTWPEPDKVSVAEDGTEEGQQELPHLCVRLHVTPPDLGQQRLQENRPFMSFGNTVNENPLTVEQNLFQLLFINYGNILYKADHSVFTSVQTESNLAWNTRCAQMHNT